jgi:hypothetical protein
MQTSWLSNLIKRAAPTRGAIPWSLQWVVRCTFESPQWKVYITSASKESYPLVTSARILSSTSMGQRPIRWSYHRSYRECIMCFMSPNSKDVWSPWPMLSLKIPSHWNWIWHTRLIPPRFSTDKTGSRATRLLDYTRFNGMITLKRNPRGNMKNSYDPTTPSFFHRGKHPKPRSPFYKYFNIGTRFLFKGEGCNTPCYDFP